MSALLVLSLSLSTYLYVSLPCHLRRRRFRVEGICAKARESTRQTDYDRQKKKKEATVPLEVEVVLSPRTDGRGSADHFPTRVSYSRSPFGYLADMSYNSRWEIC